MTKRSSPSSASSTNRVFEHDNENDPSSSSKSSKKPKKPKKDNTSTATTPTSSSSSSSSVLLKFHQPLYENDTIRRSYRDGKYQQKPTKEKEKELVKKHDQLSIAKQFPDPQDAFYLWKSLLELYPSQQFVTDCSAMPGSAGCFSWNTTKRGKGLHNKFVVDTDSWKKGSTKQPGITEDLCSKIKELESYKSNHDHWNEWMKRGKIDNLCHLVHVAAIGSKLLANGGDTNALPEFWKEQYNRLYDSSIYEKDKYEFSHRCGNGPWCIHAHQTDGTGLTFADDAQPHIVVEKATTNHNRDSCHTILFRDNKDAVIVRFNQLDPVQWANLYPQTPFPSSGIWIVTFDPNDATKVVSYINMCPHDLQCV